MKNINKEFLTTSELARILDISRVAVFKKIKSGKIRAIKDGRRYLIAKSDLPVILGNVVSDKQKRDIGNTVDKVLEEYETTLKLLGKE